MKLREMLAMVDTLVENNISAAMKVLFMNEIQNQLYRDYPLPEKVYPFSTEPGNNFYLLPADCPQDRISTLTVNGSRIQFIPSGVVDSDNIVAMSFFTIIEGMIMLSPTPIAVQTAYLFYKPSPVKLELTNLEAEPSFAADFHELMVLGCAAKVAKSNPATLGLAQVLDQDYRLLADKADRTITRKRQDRVITVRSWT